MARKYRIGKQDSSVRWSGVMRLPPEELQHHYRTGTYEDFIQGWHADVDLETGVLTLSPEGNLVVTVGARRSLDRLFAISGPPGALITIGVDNGTVNPNADFLSSTNGDGATGSSTSRRLVSFASTPTRTLSVVSAAGTFTNANVAFVMKRLFLSAEAAGTTDSDGSLYSMTNVFTMDLTSFSTWSQTFTSETTGAGS